MGEEKRTKAKDSPKLVGIIGGKQIVQVGEAKSWGVSKCCQCL